jgi:Tfp pilus assembly protein PilF
MRTSFTWAGCTFFRTISDSAKAVFKKGIAVNPKSALNYAGLGVAAFVDKDKATATTNFNQAVSLAGKSSNPLHLYWRRLPA